jgi:hypothetical protein
MEKNQQLENLQQELDKLESQLSELMESEDTDFNSPDFRAMADLLSNKITETMGQMQTILQNLEKTDE